MARRYGCYDVYGCRRFRCYVVLPLHATLPLMRCRLLLCDFTFAFDAVARYVYCRCCLMPVRFCRHYDAAG